MALIIIVRLDFMMIFLLFHFLLWTLWELSTFLNIFRSFTRDWKLRSMKISWHDLKCDNLPIFTLSINFLAVFFFKRKKLFGTRSGDLLILLFLKVVFERWMKWIKVENILFFTLANLIWTLDCHSQFICQKKLINF